MVDVEKLSDAELRSELNSRGANVGPVTGTTRSLYEKKLKKLIAAGGKTPAKPVAPKTVPKTAAASKSPARKQEKPTVDTTRRSLPRSANVTANSTFNRSEVESMSDSDREEEDDEEEEIVSPKSRQSSFRSANTSVASTGRGRPVSSTPTKKLSPIARPPASRMSTTKTTTIDTTTRIPTTPRSIHVPGLITDFTPSLRMPTFSTDRPGATPPRKSIYTPKISTAKVLHDLGNTTGEEDDDDFEGQESSRIIYQSDEPPKGIVKNAWNKVLGYGFNASKTPGDSYDLRAGASRVRVQKNPRTGKVTVKQSNVFNDAIFVALYAIIILFVVLAIAYALTTHQPKSATFSGYWGVLKAAGRDSINFFYNYAILPVVSLAIFVVLGAGIFFGHRKYKETKEQEEAKLYELIERITELVKESSADGDPYVSQPHVRDVLFPPAKRRSAEMARWEKAVKFIDSNESRVATDVLVLPSGNECAVWKWIGNKSTQKRGW